MSGFFGSALAVYGLMLGAMFVFQRSMLYFPPQERPQIAYAGVPGLEEVTTVTEDGLELLHWYRPPAAEDGPVVVIFHGNAGQIGYLIPKYRPLLEAGFGVFLAEYRGYAGNPGEPTEAGLTADGASVMAYLAAKQVPLERVVLYGESLGSGVAIKLAAGRPVAGLVLEAPPGSIADIAQAHYWYVPAKWLMRDKWNVIGLMARVSAPLLLFHGEADRVVPVRFGRRVYAAATGEKEALFLPGAGHNNLYNFPEVPVRVIDFVKRRVPGGS
jgi:fermentation-respiration switch protein FrsA (DUF1100 family)